MTRARAAHILIGLAVLFAAVIGATIFENPTLRRAVEAASVLAALSAPLDPATGDDVDAPPIAKTVNYRVQGREFSADLYHTGRDAKAALVLVPGLAPKGRLDPRLVATARVLARARFQVLVPDIPNLRALRVSPADTRHVAGAIEFLARLPVAAGGGALGVMAFSYAAGPTLLAVPTAKAGSHVDFVVTVGGYHDLEAVITFFTTGMFRQPGEAEWRQHPPNSHGKWVFILSNADRLEDRADRQILTTIARRKLADLDADIDDLAVRLGPDGAAVLAVADNRDPRRVRDRIARLPAPIRADIKALSLIDLDWSRLGARLLLVHGRDDGIIPYSESMALAQAAGAQAELFLADHLAHVDFGSTGLQDTLTLWRAVYRLLEMRDNRRLIDVPGGIGRKSRANDLEPL
ncbi:MAG: hypothetical protein ACE5EM_05750 [Sphingomonadales bacterium]